MKGREPTPQRKHSVLGLTARFAAAVLFCACFLYFPFSDVLNMMGLRWRPWVGVALCAAACAALLVLFCCLLVLLFRLAANRRDYSLSQRVWCGLGGTVLSMAVPVICWLSLLFCAILYCPEYELLQDGEPVVAWYVSGWLDGGEVYVCGDRGSFLMTSETEVPGYSDDPFEAGILPESFEWR